MLYKCKSSHIILSFNIGIKHDFYNDINETVEKAVELSDNTVKYLREDGWLRKNIIYKTTFPNGKIYIGIDWGKNGHHINYFGSWDVEYVFGDFAEDDFRDWTLRKEILFESDDASQVKEKEAGFILKYESNNPSIGYNKRPKFRDSKKQSFP